ncbi:ATP-binding protein [Streptomyces tauricus]|uniref:ATP-binding protein n=1 Tax=Streptomyces tauricus TaxID=68274 RepID=UPI0022430059|nr:hypothetical protein [Streptomyces tauricus]MCW8101708.1 hypothetical protein [Streptomyces tauricus]
MRVPSRGSRLARRDTTAHVLVSSRRVLAAAGTADGDLNGFATQCRALLTLRQQAGPLTCLTAQQMPFMTMATAQPRQTRTPKLRSRVGAQAAGEARAQVRVMLVCWNLEAYVDSRALLVSELVTNAVRHASGPRMWAHVERPLAGLLLFAVVDRAHDRLPFLCRPGLDSVPGRGQLLGQVTDRCGHDARPRAKRVRAVLRVAVP